MVRCSPVVRAKELDLERDPDLIQALGNSQASPVGIPRLRGLVRRGHASVER